ncbi:GNAT family N-acetyltransferase [Pseudomonas entomophila]|uniref:GNAT family N-acetyltransferase n=1 Tax=Pseudomonas entomophila TaxID=312306 RepID=UPI002405E085|nr:GNAT family N-acetyltransferase [Pseudomonas entomophila]MDF9620238.1 GNAT family N-acetyltransferase [Pseudomonas entomophila]
MGSADWPIYRDLRLKALLDTPDAFGSTYASESLRSDQAWQARVESALTSGRDRLLIALLDRVPCGLVWCRLSATEPVTADLYQMWVAPEARGQGAGRALLRVALDWSRDHQVHEVRLGVTVADSPAMGLYRANGFYPSGAPEPLREDSELQVQGMCLTLCPSA